MAEFTAVFVEEEDGSVDIKEEDVEEKDPLSTTSQSIKGKKEHTGRRNVLSPPPYSIFLRTPLKNTFLKSFWETDANETEKYVFVKKSCHQQHFIKNYAFWIFR